MSYVDDQAALDDSARKLVALLAKRDWRIVCAESCTGGLVAATLARLPGVSERLCGSAVVYRIETKAAWLAVPRDLLADPGPVSREVARAMAQGVLNHTPEAHLSVAITGHLGPNAPVAQDGLIFVSIAERPETVAIFEHRLPATGAREPSLRIRRQVAAVRFVLERAADYLRGSAPPCG